MALMIITWPEGSVHHQRTHGTMKTNVPMSHLFCFLHTKSLLFIMTNTQQSTKVKKIWSSSQVTNVNRHKTIIQLLLFMLLVLQHLPVATLPCICRKARVFTWLVFVTQSDLKTLLLQPTSSQLPLLLRFQRPLFRCTQCPFCSVWNTKIRFHTADYQLDPGTRWHHDQLSINQQWPSNNLKCLL